MRIRKAARPIADVETQATAQKHQADADPEAPHRRAGNGTACLTISVSIM
jgi:hypothetical protein